MDFTPERVSDPAGCSILVVAGEASGDLHASRLCEEIRRRRHTPVGIWGAGGDRLRDLGARLLGSSEHLAAIGPSDALALLGRYWRLYRAILSEVDRSRPSAVILVDFPDFNLRLARALKRKGVGPLVYFISPQVWAWRRGRIGSIRRDVDRMIVLFPFEADFYREHGIEARYFGHPLASRAAAEKNRAAFAASLGVKEESVLVALLPGSRRSEIRTMLPLVLQAAAGMNLEDRNRLVLVIAAAPGMQSEIEGQVAASGGDLAVRIVEGSDKVLANCDYWLVKSGTSTLEAALAGLPMCVLYRASFWTWLTAKCLVQIDHYALPNLVLQERAVPELMQWDATPESVASILTSFTRREPKWESVRSKLSAVKAKLLARDPYGDAAACVVEMLGACP